MYSSVFAPIPYSDPWEQPFALRLRTLLKGVRRVAYYYESANNSTFRYRAYNMAQVINSDEGNEFSAGYFFQSDGHHLSEVVRQADVLVICRSGYNQAVNQLITQFKNRGKRVLFDVDDFVFDTNYTHLLIATLGLDAHDNRVWEDWFAMVARMGQTMRMCDGAITTNAYLALRIEEFAQCKAAIVPNFMNVEQVEISQRVFDAKLTSPFCHKDLVRLGYFSGSPSHRLDFALVQEPLERIMEEDDRVQLTLVGYIEPGPGLSRFGSRVVRQPFHDYVNLQRLVGSVDVNLIPLQSNVFTNCKSELKYFESAAVGTISIGSPSINYLARVEHSKNGYVSRAHEWTRVIRHAISEIDRFPVLARAAHDDAMKHHCWTQQRDTVLAAVGLR
jgi:hypothetical protein